MTTLKEISDKLNNQIPTDFPKNDMDLDIGNYTFNSVENIDEDGFVYLYSSNNPNVKLLYNEDRDSIIRYVLDDNNMVKMDVWRRGKTLSKEKPLEEVHNIF